MERVNVLELKAELRHLIDDLASLKGSYPFEDEPPEVAADIVALMADASGTLSFLVHNFMASWDFSEDCRRARTKEQAAVDPADTVNDNEVTLVLMNGDDEYCRLQVPETAIEMFRAEAARNGRSLQDELMAIFTEQLDAALAETDPSESASRVGGEG
jgi:hypothetical protein